MALKHVVKLQKTNPIAYYLKGRMYLEGIGEKQNYTKAFKSFDEYAKKTNEAMSYNYLGYMSIKGLGTKKNLKNAIMYYSKSAKLNDLLGNYSLSIIKKSLEGNKKNKKLIDNINSVIKEELVNEFDYAKYKKSSEQIQEIKEELKSSVEQRHFSQKLLEITTNIGEIYKASEKGCIEAKIYMAGCFLEGKYVKPNYQKAYEYVMDCINEGLASGYYILAYMYDNGLGVNCDSWEAFKNYNIAYKKGYKDAQINIIKAQLVGRGCAKNEKNALKELKELSKNGNVEAQFMYAQYLDSINKKRPAKKLFNKCLEKNYGKAWYREATLQDMNKGGSNANYVEVYDMYEKAMQNGCLDAIAEMARFHCLGLVPSKDYKSCVSLINKGLSHNNPATYYAVYELSENRDIQMQYCSEFYLKVAGKLKYKPALEKLVELYSTGTDKIQKDYEKALKYKEQLAILGESKYYEELAQEYNGTIETEKNAQKVAYWNLRILRDIKDKNIIKSANKVLKTVDVDKNGEWVFLSKPRGNKELGLALNKK